MVRRAMMIVGGFQRCRFLPQNSTGGFCSSSWKWHADFVAGKPFQAKALFILWIVLFKQEPKHTKIIDFICHCITAPSCTRTTSIYTKLITKTPSQPVNHAWICLQSTILGEYFWNIFQGIDLPCKSKNGMTPQVVPAASLEEAVRPALIGNLSSCAEWKTRPHEATFCPQKVGFLKGKSLLFAGKFIVRLVKYYSKFGEIVILPLEVFSYQTPQCSESHDYRFWRTSPEHHADFTPNCRLSGWGIKNVFVKKWWNKCLFPAFTHLHRYPKRCLP